MEGWGRLIPPSVAESRIRILVSVGLWVLLLLKEVSWYCSSQSTKVPNRLSSLLYSALSLLISLHISEISLAGSEWHKILDPAVCPMSLTWLSCSFWACPASYIQPQMREPCSGKADNWSSECLKFSHTCFLIQSKSRRGTSFRSSIKPIMWFQPVS